MEKQTQNTTSLFKRIPILWKIIGTAVILAGLLFASGEISFDALTQIFGSKAGVNTSAWPMFGFLRAAPRRKLSHNWRTWRRHLRNPISP